MNRKHYVRERFWAAGVHHDVTFNSHFNQIPLPVLNVARKIDFIRLVEDVDLEAIIRPRADLHFADLVVKREVGDVYLTRASQFNNWRPEDFPVGVNHCKSLHVAISVVLGTGNTSFTNL